MKGPAFDLAKLITGNNAPSGTFGISGPVRLGAANGGNATDPTSGGTSTNRVIGTAKTKAGTAKKTSGMGKTTAASH